jgi:lambda repressor-like predicted transcriptional regulator
MVAVPRLLVGVEAEVAAAYRAGATLGQLAAQHGVSVVTVTRALDRAGQPRRPQGRRDTGVPDHDADIAAAYKAGATIAELAARYDCSVKPIRDALTRAGVTTRGFGRPRAVAGLEETIALAYESGATLTQLAAEHGVSRRLIARICQEQGVLLRPPGPRMKLVRSPA